MTLQLLLNMQLTVSVYSYSRNDNLAPHKVQSESEFSLSVSTADLVANTD